MDRERVATNVAGRASVVVDGALVDALGCCDTMALLMCPLGLDTRLWDVRYRLSVTSELQHALVSELSHHDMSEFIVFQSYATSTYLLFAFVDLLVVDVCRIVLFVH